VDGRYHASLPTPRYFLNLISCRSGCPVRTNAGAYVRAVAEGPFPGNIRELENLMEGLSVGLPPGRTTIRAEQASRATRSFLLPVPLASRLR